MEATYIRLPPPRELAAEFGLVQRRGLGQTFLANIRTLNRIVAAARIEPSTAVVEVGAGPGYLTARIRGRTPHVYAIEIDQQYRPVHDRYFAGVEPPVRFIYKDVLRMDWSQLLAEIGERYIVMGNIPYQITSPLLELLLNLAPAPERIVLLVQKEFAQRLVARPGRRAYGALTAKTAIVARAHQALFVPRQRFHPRPRVDAAAVVIEPRRPPLVEVHRLPRLFEFINACFAQRRKKLVNSLLDSGFLGHDRDAIAALIHSADLDPGQRPETLAVEELIRLFEAVERTRPSEPSSSEG